MIKQTTSHGVTTMTVWHYLLILGVGLALVFAACLAPERFFRILGKIAVNALAGVALLLLINAFSGWTNLTLPLNGLTLAVSGLLGAPGMAAMAVIAAV